MSILFMSVGWTFGISETSTMINQIAQFIGYVCIGYYVMTGIQFAFSFCYKVKSKMSQPSPVNHPNTDNDTTESNEIFIAMRHEQ